MYGQINLITRIAPQFGTHEYKLGQNMKYSINGGKLFHSNSSRTRAEDLSGNVAGALISEDGRTTYSFNVMPGLNSVEQIKKTIAEKAEAVKAAMGFVFGGQTFDGKTRESALSCDLYSNIANTIDGLNIPMAMICGKKPSFEADNMQVHGHIINLWGSLTEKIHPQMSKKEIVRTLQEAYEDVEIPDRFGIAAFEKEPSYIEANNYYASKLNSKAAN